MMLFWLCGKSSACSFNGSRRSAGAEAAGLASRRAGAGWRVDSCGGQVTDEHGGEADVKINMEGRRGGGVDADKREREDASAEMLTRWKTQAPCRNKEPR